MAVVTRAERKRRRCVALERLNSGMGVSEVNRTLVRDYVLLEEVRISISIGLVLK